MSTSNTRTRCACAIYMCKNYSDNHALVWSFFHLLALGGLALYIRVSYHMMHTSDENQYVD